MSLKISPTNRRLAFTNARLWLTRQIVNLSWSKLKWRVA